jgi:hypothetical protein
MKEDELGLVAMYSESFLSAAAALRLTLRATRLTSSHLPDVPINCVEEEGKGILTPAGPFRSSTPCGTP